MSATMRERFVDTVSAALDTDPRLAVVLADISSAAFDPARDRHPDRVVNVGIREQLMLGVAGGLALSGMRPVAHSYAPFLVERAFEQVKLDLGHRDAGAVLVSIGASYDEPGYGRTHQAPGDVALLDTLPGWTVHLPGHPDEVPGLLRSALAGDDRVYLRLAAQPNAAPHPPGMQVLRRGRDGVVVGIGPVLDAVLAATAHRDVTVLWTATARPLDTGTVRAAVAAADRADLVLVEPVLRGTSSALLTEALGDVPHRLRALGVRRDVELRSYGSIADHDAAHGLDAAGVAVALDGFLAGDLVATGPRTGGGTLGG